MKKSIIGTYWEPWEWDTGRDTEWEQGLWVIYAIEDDPDKLIIQHEDADDDTIAILARPANQRCVTRVECTHGGNESEIQPPNLPL